MKKLLFLALLSLLISIQSCSESTGCRDSRALNYDPTVDVGDLSCVFPALSLDWTLKVGNAPFEINRIYSINGKNTAFKQFQFYISKIVLERPNQSLVEFPEKFPLVKEAATEVDLGEVYVETFEKLRFNIGIDPFNNANIATYLNDPAHDLYQQHPDTMHYANVIDGFLFLKMVGKVDRNGDGIPNENEAFDFRIGTNQFLQAIELTINKDVQQERDSIHLVMDLEILLNGVDLQTEKYTNSMDSIALASKISNNIPNSISN